MSLQRDRLIASPRPALLQPGHASTSRRKVRFACRATRCLRQSLASVRRYAASYRLPPEFLTRTDHLARWFFVMTRHLDKAVRRTIGDPDFDKAFAALYTLQTLLPHGQHTLGECRVPVAVQKSL
jgi:hypothetical protein